MLIAWPASPTRKCPSGPSDDASLPATSWRSLRSWTVRPSRAPRARSCGGRACIPPISWSGAAPATPARWRHLARRVDASRPIRWPVRSSGCAGAPSGWRPSWTGPGSSSPPREISPRSWRGCWPRAPRTRPSSDRADHRRAGPGGRGRGRMPGGRPPACHPLPPPPAQPASAPTGALRAQAAAARPESWRAPAGPGRAPQRAVLRPGPGRGLRHPARRGRLPRLDLHDVPAAARPGGGGERRRQATHPATVKPELVADAPNRVWSWDITKLLGPAKWTYFYLYTILDIFSRYAVGWMVAHHESAALAERLIAETLAKQGIGRDQLAIHADRGTSMASKLVAQLLADLGVTKSHSRPHVSNDNPYSEAQFKTLKYRPAFPDHFGSIQDARVFCQDFFAWYNVEHHHSGIGLLTPADVHYGRAEQVQAARAEVLTAAYAAHPERFVRKLPQPPRLPTTAWINKPDTEQAAQ